MLLWNAVKGKDAGAALFHTILLFTHETCLFSLLRNPSSSINPLTSARAARPSRKPDYFSVTHLHGLSVTYTHTFLRSPISQWGERSKWLHNWRREYQSNILQQLLNRTSHHRHRDWYAWSQVVIPLINLICSTDSSCAFVPVLLRNLCAPISFGPIWLYVLRQRSPSKSCSHSCAERSHPVYKFHFTPLPHTGGRIRFSVGPIFFPPAFFNSH